MAFDFPNPPTAEPVTNPATGITYTYDASSQTWVVSGSGTADALETELDDLKEDVSSLQSLLPLETSARQQGDIALQGQIDEINERPDPVTDLSNYYTKPETYSQTQVDDLISNIDTGGDVNLDNYYTKDEIDNQFTLRGVGYNYLMSSFNGTPTIRPGEIHTNNRIVGQVTFISLGSEDDNGKPRRNPVVGDTIELYDSLSGKYFRYLINSAADTSYGVTYEGSEADRNDPYGMGYPFVVYLYPTHISAANYYDKATSDERFMQLGVGSTQYCNRITEFNQTVKYNGAIGSSKSITTKQYVDTAVAGLASVQYVNEEVDKMITSFNTEDAEPDIFYGDYAPTGEMKNGNVWFDSMNLRMNVWSQGAWVNPDREGDSVNLEPYQKIVQPPGRKFKKISATQPTTSGSFTYYETNGQVKIGLNRRDAEGVKWLDIDFNDTLAAPVLFRIIQWQNNTSHHTVRYGAIEKIVATEGGQIVCDVKYHQTNGTISDNSNYFITIGGLI